MTFSLPFKSLRLWNDTRCDGQGNVPPPPPPPSSSRSPSSSIASPSPSPSSSSPSPSPSPSLSSSSSSSSSSALMVAANDRNIQGLRFDSGDRQRSRGNGDLASHSVSIASQRERDPDRGFPSRSGNRRKIVIAVDHSEDSENAVRWAVDNHLRPDDHVTLLHVKRPADALCGPGVYAAFSDSSMAPEAMAEPDLKQEKRLEMATQAMTDRLRKMVCTQTTVRCDPLIIDDLDARERICGEVNQLRADTLIMGSRGMGRVKRLLLGSVSDYCVNHCPCPVVVVRKKSYCDGPSTAPTTRRDASAGATSQQAEECCP
ncbi:hypothetical protein CBR_g17960 [Chara braunii]|uniref:UspA domain-containing protein n=1 Tax=Chara braunii TaxID=69332 RepID=A0A388KW08_CHABU|nr:hypothetical protein CBR_g17960 [Chara braunii]|eukprot:GBG74250.1 hypothetical protein CBR_g17960 [Chara braunii]